MRQTKIPSFRLFTAFSTAFLIGIALSTFFDLKFSLSWQIFLLLSLSLVFAALINFLLKARYMTLAIFCFISCLIGVAYYSLFNSQLSTADISLANQSIEAKVVRKPERTFAKQNVVVALPTRQIAAVALPNYPRIEYSDTLKFSGNISRPSEAYNQENILKGKEIGLVIQNPSAVEIVQGRLTAKEKVYQDLFAISDLLEETFNRLLPEPHASLANGLILGAKANMPDDYKTALSQTGLTHLIALSGYNVTIIITALSALLLGVLSRRWVFLIGALTVIMFVILTGASASIIRAAIFAIALMLGRIIGRKAYITNILLATALLMVLFNPFVLRYDLGFQLSFLAFSGIIYFSPVLHKYSEKEKFHFIPGPIKTTLVETLSAQLMVFPLIMIVFGNISLIAPLSNLLVLWIVPLTMLLCFLTGFLGLLFLPLGKLLALVCWPFLNYIVTVPAFLSKIPFASFQLNDISWVVALGLYAAFFSFLKIAYLKRKLAL